VLYCWAVQPVSRRLTAVAVVASAMITALLSSTPAYAAVPRIVLVYGPLLAQPVIMTDWAANVGVQINHPGTAEMFT